jgi:hypothetical protein
VHVSTNGIVNIDRKKKLGAKKKTNKGRRCYFHRSLLTYEEEITDKRQKR